MCAHIINYVGKIIKQSFVLFLYLYFYIPCLRVMGPKTELMSK